MKTYLEYVYIGRFKVLNVAGEGRWKPGKLHFHSLFVLGGYR